MKNYKSRYLASSNKVTSKVKLKELKIEQILSESLTYDLLKSEQDIIDQQSDSIHKSVKHTIEAKEQLDSGLTKEKCETKKQETIDNYQRLKNFYFEAGNNFLSKFRKYKLKSYYYSNNQFFNQAFRKAVNYKHRFRYLPAPGDFISSNSKERYLDQMGQLIKYIYEVEDLSIRDEFQARNKIYEKNIGETNELLDKYLPSYVGNQWNAHGDVQSLSLESCLYYAKDSIYLDEKFEKNNFFKEIEPYSFQSLDAFYLLAKYGGVKILADDSAREKYNDLLTVELDKYFSKMRTEKFSDKKRDKKKFYKFLIKRYRKSFKKYNKVYKSCLRNVPKIIEQRSVAIQSYTAFANNPPADIIDKREKLRVKYNDHLSQIAGVSSTAAELNVCQVAADRRAEHQNDMRVKKLENMKRADKLSMVAFNNLNQTNEFEAYAKKIIDLNNSLVSGLSGLELVKAAYESLLLQHLLKSNLNPSFGLNKINSALNDVKANNIFDLKVNFENKLSKLLWKNKVASYQVNSSNIFDLVNSNLMQCYSGTLHFVHALLNSNIDKNLILNNVVIISTKGHVSPGVVLIEDGKEILYGIESTTLGPSKKIYGPTKNISGNIRITMLVDYLVIEALKANILNMEDTLQATYIDITDLGFKPEQLKPYKGNEYENNNSYYDIVNNSPFGYGLGVLNVTDEIKERSSTNQDVLPLHNSLSNAFLVNLLGDTIQLSKGNSLHKANCRLVDVNINQEIKYLNVFFHLKEKLNQLLMICNRSCNEEEHSTDESQYHKIFKEYKSKILNQEYINDLQLIRNMKLEVRNCNPANELYSE